MPLKRRLDKSRRLTDEHRQQLLEGPDACLLAGVGYLATGPFASTAAMTPDQRAAMVEEMRQDWALHGARLLAAWQAGEIEPGQKPWVFVVPDPDALPWAALEFGEPLAHNGAARS